MIPAHLSLVPLSPERRAAMQAIAEVESTASRGIYSAAYPYTRAFFRHFRGSQRVTVREINYFAPVLTAQELRGRKDSWLNAIDRLIESRGTRCYLPLPSHAGSLIFPEVVFQETERRRRQTELKEERYSRQRRRQASSHERAYQALAAQAEIDLAFQTPETVSSWGSRWSGTKLKQYDLEDMFFRWSERFPSLISLERRDFYGQPFWRVMYEASMRAKEAGPAVRSLERWMVPNKLISKGEPERCTGRKLSDG
ncbi:MAG: plasmid SOS inhibition protein A [Pantoea sp.]|uniref:plasmid SOS inhibition protein A n=1 Tax=Pantoea sp. TaxID=69393 RepID=UPI0023833395|nr:plasmid SOS inhibition protein A [Pantoea sp.]MDE1188860.1 plasmid SOS inhibition protein A [Pantoea sp.]